MHQVLIIGAGPVGLTMAVELARYGISVRVIDKAAAASSTSKALVVWSRTLELLDRAGCAQALVAAGQPLSGANIFAGRRRLARVGFDTIASPFPYALMLPQSETERILGDHLSALGVTVERNVEAVRIQQSETGVTTVLRGPGGAEADVSSDWLIGCDGAHSLVRHQLGLGFAGETMNTDWLLADVHLEGLATPKDELATWLHGKGLVAIFPIADGRYRVIADAGAANGRQPPIPTLPQLQTILDDRGPGGVTASRPIWMSGFRISERQVSHYCERRVFLAGDAAHIHSPAGGQGMNTGMQDAFNLSWKLALVCHAAATSLLASYDQERNPVGASVITNAGKLTALGMIKNPALQAARNCIVSVVARIPAVQKRIADRLSGIDISYPQSLLNGPRSIGGRDVQPGARWPPIAGQLPVSSSGHPRFVLFAEDSPAVRSVLLAYPDLVEPDIQPAPRPGMLLLVRPDGYIACAEKTTDSGAIHHYLEMLMRRPREANRFAARREMPKSTAPQSSV